MQAKRYYVNNNSQANGDHEVHTSGCPYFRKIRSKTPLGLHYSCHTAVAAAKRYYFKADGCYYCCPQCHRR